MDHTPGQGQYRDLEVYRETIDKYHGMENEGKTFEEVLEHHQHKVMLSLEQLQELADLAHQNHITVASHDDDTVEKLQLNQKLGVDISEFPITQEVAQVAHNMGFYTIAGAPNILLGGSHSGNMSAAQAIQNGSVDILCSDYFPQALLHSLFVMRDKYGQTLPEMVNKVSLNPAKAMGIDHDYGSIEPGKKADLVIADILDGYPVVTHVLVDGQTTSRVEYRGAFHMSILEIKGLGKNFYLHHANREIHSCENINFSLEEGQFIGIVGRSGAGKSTILKCISPYLSANRGRYSL